MTESKSRIEELAKIYLLLSIEGIGTGKLLNLFSKFDSFDDILDASVNSLLKVDNINSTLAQRIFNSKNNLQKYIESGAKELENLSKINAKTLTFWDEDYPPILKKIYSPPVLLYYIGNIELLFSNNIAIVGTRLPSAYGKIVAEKLSKELVENNITIVSGLARGIDSIAHNTAIAQNGNTIAVIGSGLDIIYPPENRKLFNQIAEKGLIISEYPLGTKPDPQNFPRRNRIISGLSLGTLVVETRIAGGAMQTAQFALDQGREVFAVPGNIVSPQSEGTNFIIQKGEAKLVSNANDILVELNIKKKADSHTVKPIIDITLTVFEQKIMDVLSDNPKHIDIIASDSGLSTSDCLVNLLSLEFKGVARQLAGKMFVTE